MMHSNEPYLRVISEYLRVISVYPGVILRLSWSYLSSYFWRLASSAQLLLLAVAGHRRTLCQWHSKSSTPHIPNDTLAHVLALSVAECCCGFARLGPDTENRRTLNFFALIRKNPSSYSPFFFWKKNFYSRGSQENNSEHHHTIRDLGENLVS